METAQDTMALANKLISYLRTRLRNPALAYASPLARLQGGYETTTYHFELDHTSDELSGPMVLRLYPPSYSPRNAIWESTVQNVLAEQGYPVARAHLVCTDMSVLGGAFFIMDYLLGQPLVAAPLDTAFRLLGKTHAELHNIDPAPLIQALHDQGIAESSYRLSEESGGVRDTARQLPWIAPAVNWLLAHRPPGPERLAVCHGDFHPLNLLYADGRITGVLDWPGFAVADPAFDVANSLVLITIPFKRLAATTEGFSSVDWDRMVDLYLASYRAHRPLDNTNLDYYRVRRCVLALAEGFRGHPIWQHPLVVTDLVAYIREVTGIQITVPSRAAYERAQAGRLGWRMNVLANLIVRTVLGFAFLMLVLAVALFVPAGSFGFWQAWVYLAVWGVCVVLITAYLIKYDQRLLAGRVKAGPVAETQKSQQIIQSLASLFFIALFIVPGLDHRFHWSAVPPVLSLVADAFVAFGFSIVFLVFRENTYTSATIEVSDEQEVIATGPYSVVRHPMYAGAALLLLFTPLALGSWVALPCPLPLILVVAARLVQEEKYLLAHLAGYEGYRQKVRYRLIPFIW
jgi:aminoglycoside phosphotransferase (APT) family kinase protein/protein-S-isoprenylcysteine O-methyltransferase Ste14